MYEWVCTVCHEAVAKLGGSSEVYSVGRIAPAPCCVCGVLAAGAVLNAVPARIVRAYRQADGGRESALSAGSGGEPPNR